MQSFNYKKSPMLETLIHFGIFLTSLCFGFIGIFSIFIPFLITENFNFLIENDVKNLSYSIFKSPSLLLYYLTVATSWLFIAWSLINSIFMVALTNVVIDNILDKEMAFSNRLLNFFFIIFITAITVSLLVFVNQHTIHW